MSANANKLGPVLGITLLSLAVLVFVELRVSRTHMDVVTVKIHASAGPSFDEHGLGGVPRGDSAGPLHDEARALARRGELELAVGRYLRVVRAHPSQGALRAELGYWQLVADRDGDALATLEKASRQAPANPMVSMLLGQARERADDLAGAEEAYRQALSLHRGYGDARLALGTLLREAGRPAEAIEVLGPAARIQGTEQAALALALLGRAQLAHGLRQAGGCSLRDAVQRAPASVRVRLAVARAWMYDGAPEDLAWALDVLDETLRLAPEVPQVHSAQARALELNGEVAAAELAYLEALRLDPDYHHARRRALRLTMDRGDLDAALGHVEQLMARAGDEPEHALLAGLVERRSGDLERARQHYREALELSGGRYAEAWYNLGLLEKGAGETWAAVRAYERAIEVEPGYREARNNLALALEDAGRTERAERTLRALLEERPDYAAAWLNLGGLLSRGDRHLEAILCYERVLQLRPEDRKALLNRGVALARAGDPEAAVRAYEELLALHPRSVSGWYNLALSQKQRGELDAAREALQTAQRLEPGHRASAESLARLELKAGEPERAVRWYRGLLDEHPTDSRLRMALADALLDAGDEAGCRRELRKVLTTEPDNQQARRAWLRIGGGES